MRTTINSDMGESVGIHSFGHDEELLGYVDTINVACGMHAGDPGAMRRVVEQAVAAGVSIGAHPGLPDIAGFGRREMAVDADEVRDLVLYQVGALVGFLDAAGAPLHHIKAHGALYGMMSRDPALMGALCDVALQYGVPVFGLGGTPHEEVARARGVEFVSEYYVDLDYNDDHTIRVQRTGASRPLDSVAERARSALHEGVTRTVSGGTIDVRAESFCIHSDLPNAVEVARVVRELVGERVGA
jgi:UPF0271 protein